MCGITGIINHAESTNAIHRMTDRLAHRGPNAEGYFIGPVMALGHRRLSIIDLSEGANQPQEDASGNFVLVFNGEIYNYREIKAKGCGSNLMYI